MAESFNVVDMDGVGQELNIEVRPGRVWEGMDLPSGTNFVIAPPLTEEEHLALIDNHSPGSQTGELMRAGGLLEEDRSLTINVGDEPSEEQVELGIELAKDIITLKGLRWGRVVSAIGETTHAYLVQAQEVHDVTVIGADEFEEASRNPANNALLEEARQYVQNLDDDGRNE